MALICDTSGVYSLYDADDAGYAATTRVVESEAGPLLLPVILLAEIDYLLHSRLGADAAFQFLEAVEQGDFTLIPLLALDLARCRELLVQYRDLEIGLADGHYRRCRRAPGPSTTSHAGSAPLSCDSSTRLRSFRVAAGRHGVSTAKPYARTSMCIHNRRPDTNGNGRTMAGQAAPFESR